jgi:hypothetical protein
LDHEGFAMITIRVSLKAVAAALFMQLRAIKNLMASACFTTRGGLYLDPSAKVNRIGFPKTDRTAAYVNAATREVRKTTRLYQDLGRMTVRKASHIMVHRTWVLVSSGGEHSAR